MHTIWSATKQHVCDIGHEDWGHIARGTPCSGRGCRNLREIRSRCGHVALKAHSRHAQAEPAVSTCCKVDKGFTFISHTSSTLTCDPFDIKLLFALIPNR